MFAKPRQVNAWPILCGFDPLLADHDGHQNNGSNRIHLHLENVYKVDAVGLCIFLAKLAHICLALESAEFKVFMPLDTRVERALTDLGLHQLLSKIGKISDVEDDLFGSLHTPSKSLWFSGDKAGQLSETIICVSPAEGVSRSESISTVRREIKKFLEKDVSRRFAREQFMVVIQEMVKNTLDHSNGPAFLALQRSDNGGRGALSFAYCDSGDGLCRNVRGYIETLVCGNNSNIVDLHQMIRLHQKGGMSDILHWALKSGNSTKKGNGVNCGLGLMLIVEGARNCGIRLIFKDADSIWALSHLSVPFTHTKIRACGVKTSAAPLMMFYGDLQLRS